MLEELEDVFTSRSQYTSLGTPSGSPVSQSGKYFLEGLGGKNFSSPDKGSRRLSSPFKLRDMKKFRDFSETNDFERNTIKHFQTQKDTLEEKNSALEVTGKELQTHELKEKNRKLEAMKKDLQTQKDELEEKNSELQTTIYCLEKKLVQSEKSVPSIEDDLYDSQKREDELKKDLTQLFKQKRGLQTNFNNNLNYLEWAGTEFKQSEEEIATLREKVRQFSELQKQFDASQGDLSSTQDELRQSKKNEISLKKEIEPLRKLKTEHQKAIAGLVKATQLLKQAETTESGLKEDITVLKNALTAAHESSSLKQHLLIKEFSVFQNNLAILEDQLGEGVIKQEISRKLATFAKALNTNVKKPENITIADFNKELEYVTAERNRYYSLYYHASERFSKAEDTIEVFTSIIEDINNLLNKAHCRLNVTTNDSDQAPYNWAKILSELQAHMETIDEMLKPEEKESTEVVQHLKTASPCQYRELILSLKAIQNQCVDISNQYESLVESNAISKLANTNFKTDRMLQAEAENDYSVFLNLGSQFKELEMTLDVSAHDVYNYLDTLRNKLNNQVCKQADQMCEMLNLKMAYSELREEVQRQLDQKDGLIDQIQKRADFMLNHLPQLMSLKFATAVLDKIKIDFAYCKANQSVEEALVASCEQKISLLEKKLSMPTKNDAFKAMPYIISPWKTYSQNYEGFEYEEFDVFDSQSREFSWGQFKLTVSGTPEPCGTQYAKLDLYQSSTQHAEASSEHDTSTEDIEHNLQKIIVSLVQLIAPYAEQDSGVVVTIEGSEEYAQILVNYLYANEALWKAFCGSEFNITIKTPQYPNGLRPTNKMLEDIKSTLLGQDAFFSKNIAPSNADTTMLAPAILAH